MERETPPEPRPRQRQRQRQRRSRTRTLIALAAVVGVVGGTAVGYTVQADRPPTPLPALAQTGLTYPAKSLPRGQEPRPFAAENDRRVRTDGDLRKLLVAKPAGAREAADARGSNGWMDLATFADKNLYSGDELEQLLRLDVRRIAHAEWQQAGNRTTSVKLVQFRPGSKPGIKLGVLHFTAVQMAGLPDGEEPHGEPLKGRGNGRYALLEPQQEAGYLPTHEARAVFRRGDVVALISIFDTKQISKSDIRSLAERQLERL